MKALTSFRALLRQWKTLRRFEALSSSQRQIVFYAQEPEAWHHFRPLIESLAALEQRMSYVTTLSNDPALRELSTVPTYCLEHPLFQNLFLDRVQANVVVTCSTKPENLKRSKRFPVHYVHILPSLMSTHGAHSYDAFERYDTVFCSAPHQIEELQQLEALHRQPKKHLVPFGNGLVDRLTHENLSDSVKQAFVEALFPDLPLLNPYVARISSPVQPLNPATLEDYRVFNSGRSAPVGARVLKALVEREGS